MMPRLRPATNANAWPVHADWRAIWAPTLTDNALRQAIWDGSRFADRVVADLLETECGPSDEVHAERRDIAVLEDALRLGRGDVFHYLGLLWLSPVLAPKILNAASRSQLGPLSKAEIEAILAARDHAPADLVGPMLSQSGIAEEGMRCLLAWLDTLPEAMRDRSLLLLPRLPVFDAETEARTAARAALVVRAYEMGNPSKDTRK